MRASDHPEGSTVSVRPGHPYDTRWRVLGLVGYDQHARHAFFGGELPDGTRETSIPEGWRVDERMPAPRYSLPSEPDYEPDVHPYDGPCPEPHIVPRTR